MWSKGHYHILLAEAQTDKAICLYPTNLKMLISYDSEINILCMWMRGFLEL